MKMPMTGSGITIILRLVPQPIHQQRICRAHPSRALLPVVPLYHAKRP
jgi:hypothetical protein